MTGGGGSGSSTQTVTQQLSPEQKRLFSMIAPTLEQFVQNPPTLYPEPTVQPFTEDQLAAQEAGRQAAGQIGQLSDVTLQQQQQFLQQSLDPLSNPYLMDLINASVQPITDQLTQQILPSIRGEAILAGGYGGSRQGIAEGLATQGATRAASDIAARIGSDAFTSGQENFARGLFATPGLAELALKPAGILDVIGAQQQSQQERAISELSQRWLESQLLPYSSAKDVAGIIFGMPTGQSTATTSGTSGSVSPFAGALGGAAIGSTFGPWGALAGGAIGLLASFL